MNEATMEKPTSQIIERINIINKIIRELEDELQPILLEPRPVEEKEGEETSRVLIELNGITERLNDILNRIRI